MQEQEEPDLWEVHVPGGCCQVGVGSGEAAGGSR